MGSEVQVLESCSAAFPGHKQRAGLEMEQLGQELVLIKDACAIGRGLPCYPTVQAPDVLIVNILSLQRKYINLTILAAYVSVVICNKKY